MHATTDAAIDEPVILTTSSWCPAVMSVSAIETFATDETYIDAISAIDAVVTIVKIHVAM